MDSFLTLYSKDLDQLREEISSYTEQDLWLLKGSIANSPGNLAIHICGNLKHFLGAALGNTGYERDRDNEFAAKGIPKEKILKEIDSTKKVVEKVLNGLSVEDLQMTYPWDKFGENQTIGFVLMRLAMHMSYHLGQINYHRRMLSKTANPAVIGA